MDDELLIDLVEGYPILYDRKHIGYKNMDKKLKVWQKIAQHMETDDNNVRRRWLNLRERFTKEIRQPPPPQWDDDSELPDVPPPRRWALLDRLSFLKNHIIQRPARQGPQTNKIIRPKVEYTTFKMDPLDILDNETKTEHNAEQEEQSHSLNEEHSQSMTRSPSRSRSPTPPQVSSTPLGRAPSRAAELNTQQSIPSSSAHHQGKRKALDVGDVDSAMIETTNLFKEICEQKARTPAIDPAISGFTTMIGAMIAKFKTKRRITVIQRCTEIVMQAAIEEEDEQFYK
ncbi:transcription factor Adf-1-like isoform X2 [Eurosta solidaginis]